MAFLEDSFEGSAFFSVCKAFQSFKQLFLEVCLDHSGWSSKPLIILIQATQTRNIVTHLGSLQLSPQVQFYDAILHSKMLEVPLQWASTPAGLKA